MVPSTGLTAATSTRSRVPGASRRLLCRPIHWPPSRAIEITHIPTMFAMNAMTHTREFCGRQNVQTGQVAGVDHSGLQTSAQLKQLFAHFPHARFRAVQGKDLSVGTRDALTKIRIILYAGHSMSQTFLRHAVDQIDQAVFHATYHQMMDNMQNEGPRVGCHLSPRQVNRNTRSVCSQ